MSEQTVLVRNGTVYSENGVIADGAVLISGDKIVEVGQAKHIEAIGARIIDADGGLICPGLIDLHLNGGGGRDVLEGTADAMAGIARGHAKFGTTALLIAVPGIDDDRAMAALSAIADTSVSQTGGARVLGSHMEGPFINPKQRGIIPGDWLMEPSSKKLESYISESRRTLRIMTLAPELEHADDLIRSILAAGIVASIGHSDATYDEANDGIRAGISYASHTFNAMHGFNHKDPGAVGAVLMTDSLTAEVVADGHHVHPGAVSVLWKCKGADKVALVTDSVEVIGTDQDEFQVAGTPIKVRDGRTYSPNGGLAGSVLTLNKAIANICGWLDLPPEEVLPAATTTPARVLGISGSKGSIAVGKDADLAIFDHEMQPRTTVVEGTIVFEA